MNQPDIKDIKISVPKIGDEIDCTFSRKDKEFIYVEFGYKSEGRINIGEFTDEEIIPDLIFIVNTCVRGCV